MKTFIYTLIIAAVIIGGFLVYKNNPPTDADSPNIIVIGRNGEIKGEYPLKDIIAIDMPYQCEFDREDNDSKVKGEIFIAPGAKVRGDFNITSTSISAPFDSHFIMIGGFTYSWTSLLNIGFRAPIAQSSSTESTLMSVNEKIKYHCARWQADQSKFQIPADVNFKDARN
jgi:hypothetical protein